jgi:hypothetical protein
LEKKALKWVIPFPLYVCQTLRSFMKDFLDSKER